MVDLALLAKEGQELYVSKRPMLLVPEPVSVCWMFRAWRMAMLPHSAQSIAPMQQVKVPLLRRVVPRPSRAGARSLAREYHGIAPSDAVARYARIQFSKEVQSLSATLRFDAQMRGIPYVRHRTIAADSQLLHGQLPNHFSGLVPRAFRECRNVRGRRHLALHRGVPGP